MSKFAVGDRVKRIGCAYGNLKVGDRIRRVSLPFEWCPTGYDTELKQIGGF